VPETTKPELSEESMERDEALALFEALDDLGLRVELEASVLTPVLDPVGGQRRRAYAVEVRAEGLEQIRRVTAIADEAQRDVAVSGSRLRLT
jgi:hypothetical protein